MNTKVISFFIVSFIFLIIPPGFIMRDVISTTSYNLEKKISFNEINWNLSYAYYVYNSTNHPELGVKASISLSQQITVKQYVSPPVNLKIYNPVTNRWWCMCPPQRTISNKTLVANTSYGLGGLTHFDQIFFLNNSIYTFILDVYFIGENFEDFIPVNVNGSSIIFNDFQQSKIGILNITENIITPIEANSNNISSMALSISSYWIIPLLLQKFIRYKGKKLKKLNK